MGLTIPETERVFIPEETPLQLPVEMPEEKPEKEPVPA